MTTKTKTMTTTTKTTKRTDGRVCMKASSST
jgi:hypothetical protein